MRRTDLRVSNFLLWFENERAALVHSEAGERRDWTDGRSRRHVIRTTGALVGVATAVAWLLATMAAAQIAPAPAAEGSAEALQQLIDQAASHYAQRRFAEASGSIRSAQQLFERLVAGQDVVRGPSAVSLERQYRRLATAHGLLEAQGQSLPPLSDVRFELPHDPSDPISASQRSTLQAIERDLTIAAALYRQQQWTLCGQQLVQAQRRIAELAAAPSPPLLAELKPLHEKIARAHQSLAARGVVLSPLAPLPAANAANGQAPNTGSRVAAQSPNPRSNAEGNQGISFARQVAPILMARCGRCHIQAQRGELSMASFAALLQGGASGQAPIEPGSPADSLLVQLVRDGDMPPNRPLAAEELQVIEQWIGQGARFDGPSPQAPLASYAQRAPGDRGAARGAAGAGGRRGPMRRGGRGRP